MSTNSSATSKRKNQLPIEALKKSRKLSDDEAEDTIISYTDSTMSSPTSSNLMRKKVTSQPPKKLVIGFIKAPQLPESFEEETWKKLKEAIQAIHHQAKISSGLEELYKAAEALSSQKTAGNLYGKLETECSNHIEIEGKKLLGQTADSLAFLTLVDTCWQQHCQQMSLIRSIFLVLDRAYVLQSSVVKSIWDMGLQLFRQFVITNQEIEGKTVASILNLIERDRNGETVNKTLLKSLLRMFSSLNIYSDRFEKQFLDATTSFYCLEGNNKLQEYDLAEYLRYVEQRLQEENNRVVHYLDSTTKKPLISILEKQLLEVHIPQIIEKGFDTLIDGNRHQDLGRLYLLFSRVSGLDALKVAWNAYIKRTGVILINDPERDKNLVQDLLDYKAKLDFILEESFHRNNNFYNSLKEAFEVFVNVRKNKPAELIAKFVDEKLKSGKGTTEEELETLLDKVMTLFRFIQGKDVFEAFYKKDLAKRLLLGKSSSFDAEKSMIAKLKTECGSNFTNKLEGMFKDIDLSKDIMSSFKESATFTSQLNHLPHIDLNVYVLTTGNWPAYPPADCKIPSDMGEFLEVFKSFYLSKHVGRRLMWQHSLGHCTLRLQHEKLKREVSVSLYQALVLLLFNDADDLSYTTIQETTGIEENELKRTLQSIACGKYRILTKKPKGRDVNSSDSFCFNTEFTVKQFRIKINSIQMKETPEEAQKTNETIIQDRQYQIDAAIVRIMKTRKSLTHQLLVAEVFSQLKFDIKPSDLKKRIESLIDREYLERDMTNTSLYHYLA